MFDYERSVLYVLLIGWEPLNDPVARYGPFVMNTQDEIYEAIEDYRSGKMGVINPNIGISKLGYINAFSNEPLHLERLL